MSDEIPSLEQTIIGYGPGVITVTREDARQMGRALGTYLSKSRDEIAKNVSPDLMEVLPRGAGDAWIDPRGKVHVGPWQLESFRGQLVFSWYKLVPDSPVIYRYMADLVRVEEQWRVTSVSVQILR